MIKHYFLTNLVKFCIDQMFNTTSRFDFTQVQLERAAPYKGGYKEPEELHNFIKRFSNIYMISVRAKKRRILKKRARIYT